MIAGGGFPLIVLINSLRTMRKGKIHYTLFPTMINIQVLLTVLTHCQVLGDENNEDHQLHDWILYWWTTEFSELAPKEYKVFSMENFCFDPGTERAYVIKHYYVRVRESYHIRAHNAVSTLYKRYNCVFFTLFIVINDLSWYHYYLYL